MLGNNGCCFGGVDGVYFGFGVGFEGFWGGLIVVVWCMVFGVGWGIVYYYFDFMIWEKERKKNFRMYEKRLIYLWFVDVG